MMIFFFPKGSICFLIKRDRRGLKTTISTQEKEKHMLMMMTLSPGRAQKCAHHHRQKKVLLIRLKEKECIFVCEEEREEEFAKYTGVVRCSKQQQKKTLKNSLSKRESKEAGRIPRLGSSYCDLFLSRGLSLFSSFFFVFLLSPRTARFSPNQTLLLLSLLLLCLQNTLSPPLFYSLSLSLSLFLSLFFSLSLSLLCSALN